MSSIAALVALASELPDPGKLSIFAVGSGLGGFTGALIGRARRLPSEQIAQMVADGAFWGFGSTLACWLVAVAIDRL